MVTDCFGARAFDFSDTEAVFLQGSFSLLKMIIPAAICVLLWKLYVANKDGDYRQSEILGLRENRSIDHSAKTKCERISLLMLFLYFATAAVTFSLGLLSFHAYELALAISAK
jgi:hypothetical protein